MPFRKADVLACTVFRKLHLVELVSFEYHLCELLSFLFENKSSDNNKDKHHHRVYQKKRQNNVLQTCDQQNGN